MDLNSLMPFIQTGLAIMTGALAWFIQRSVKKFDEGLSRLEQKIDENGDKLDKKIEEGLAKLDQKIEAVDQRHELDIKQLRQDFNDFLKNAPMLFALREDFIRIMNAVEEKLNQLLYGHKGGNAS